MSPESVARRISPTCEARERAELLAAAARRPRELTLFDIAAAERLRLGVIRFRVVDYPYKDAVTGPGSRYQMGGVVLIVTRHSLSTAPTVVMFVHLERKGTIISLDFSCAHPDGLREISPAVRRRMRTSWDLSTQNIPDGYAEIAEFPHSPIPNSNPPRRPGVWCRMWCRGSVGDVGVAGPPVCRFSTIGRR
ncbi:hypothetical protein AB0B25_32165 [Nocardia sp. NPDC049190]|uniref:hypothetical protein n=1 Tax=Nocardia sp. NPDC049190 TaxID=3155650 RepID=UPI00340FB906